MPAFFTGQPKELPVFRTQAVNERIDEINPVAKPMANGPHHIELRLDPRSAA
jgi:hypothetical protein